jgi:hypothetical protein
MDETAEIVPSAATVEHLNRDGPARITLTDDAAKRLDIQTAAVQQSEVVLKKQ